MDKIIVGIALLLFSITSFSITEQMSFVNSVSTKHNAVSKVKQKKSKIKNKVKAKTTRAKTTKVKIIKTSEIIPQNVDKIAAVSSNGNSALNLSQNISRAQDTNLYSSKKIRNAYPYFNFIVGASVVKVGNTQQDAITGAPNNSHYLAVNNYYGDILYGVGGGYEFKIKSTMLMSIGIGVYQNSDYFSSGRYWVDGDPTTNSDYRYGVRSTRFMFEGQFGWKTHFNNINLIPFVFLGVGSSLNFANSYQETNTGTGGATRNPNFQTNSIFNFSYQVGLGLSFPFNCEHDRLSIAYKYADLGKARFNPRDGSPNYVLDIGRLKANEVYFGYTHLFDL